MIIFLWRLPLPMYKYSLPDGHACCLYKDEKGNGIGKNNIFSKYFVETSTTLF